MNSPLGAVVVDIDFKVTKNGNLVPVLTLSPPLEYKCPNLYTLQKQGVWIGDTVWISPKDGSVEVNKALRPIDATPAQLPHGCPDCGWELTILLDRRLAVKCPNNERCSAQTNTSES